MHIPLALVESLYFYLTIFERYGNRYLDPLCRCWVFKMISPEKVNNHDETVQGGPEGTGSPVRLSYFLKFYENQNCEQIVI